MSRALDSVLVRCAFAVLLVFALGTAQAGSPETGSGSGRRVVGLNDGETAAEFCGRHGLTLIDSIDSAGGRSLLVEGDDAALAEAAADPGIVSSELDRPVELSETAILDPAVVALLNPDVVSLLTDPETIWDGRNLWKKSMVRQPGLDRIDADNALMMASGSGIRVAIVDTGIDPTHPALSGSILPGFNFVNESTDTNELSDLPQSTVDGLRSSASLNPAVVALLNPSTVALLNPGILPFLSAPPPYFGHGTLVAGLIHVIAPGASIVPVKAFDSSGVSTSFRIAKAIRYAVDSGAHVINMSFDMDELSPVVSVALDYAEAHDVILIASVGNRNKLVSSTFPASYPGVLGVAAMNRNDRKAMFSNFGPAVKVSAPGDGLISTYPAGLYAGIGGTSFAAAVVSAEAALARSNSTAPAADIVRRILGTTEPIADRNRGTYLGVGRINAEACVRSQ